MTVTVSPASASVLSTETVPFSMPSATVTVKTGGGVTTVNSTSAEAVCGSAEESVAVTVTA